MKNFFKIIFMIGSVICVYFYKDSIADYITDKIIYKDSNKVLSYNEYYLNNDYIYVQNIDTYKVNSYQEVLNMIYTIINSGDDSFTFKCNYDNCINDVKNIIDTNDIVANINNFVHPFNSFNTINIDVNEIGAVTVKVKKAYSNQQIKELQEYVDNFISSNINDTMSDYDKIKVFHDYIINNTIYDESVSNTSYSAYVLITEGKSICGGYSDIMSIYLNTLGIKNYKIISLNHVWNLVYLDNIWYHLDVTWDDPVASDGNQYLIDNFFMLKTSDLLALDNVEHNFDRNIYKEADY